MNNIGLYIDGENIPYNYFNQLFEIINKIKGKIIFKKLYCDFGLLGINGNYYNVKDYCLNNSNPFIPKKIKYIKNEKVSELTPTYLIQIIDKNKLILIKYYKGGCILYDNNIIRHSILFN